MEQTRKQLLASFKYDQFTPEAIGGFIGITERLGGDLIVNVSIPIPHSFVIPEMPLSLGARADRHEADIQCKRGRELMAVMKQRCAEAEISFTGMISQKKRIPPNTKPPADAVLLPGPFGQMRPSCFITGHYGLKHLKKKNIPVWLMPTSTLEFDVFYFFTLSPDITVGQAGFIKENRRRFKLPNPRCLKNKNAIIDLLEAEIASPCSVLERPSLLLFAESCFYGVPLINKLYRRFLAFLNKSAHHVVILPE